MTIRFLPRALTAALAVALLPACGSDDSSGGTGNSGADGGSGGGAGADGGSGGGSALPKPELDFAAFDAAVEQFLTEHNLTGASGVIVHKDWGMIHLSGYG